MNNDSLQDMIAIVPAIQSIGNMVGSNPFVDYAENRSFFDTVMEVSKYGKEMLPSFEMYADYYRECHIDVNILYNYLKKNYGNLSPENFNLLYGGLLYVLQNDVKATKIDRYTTLDRYMLYAEFIKEQIDFDLPEYISEQVCKILMLFKSNGKTELFYQWKRLYGNYNRKWKKLLSQVPEKKEDAIDYILKELKIINHEQYVKIIVNKYSGWLGYLKSVKPNDNKYVTDYILIWLLNEYFIRTYEIGNISIINNLSKQFLEYNHKQHLIKLSELYSLLGLICNEEESSVEISILDIKYILLESLEETTRFYHLNSMNISARFNQFSNKNIWLFCMDPRSEQPRRIIENRLYDITFGCAGFFNVPLVIKQNNQLVQYYPGKQNAELQQTLYLTFLGTLSKVLAKSIDNQRKLITSAFQHYELFGLFYLIKSLLQSLKIFKAKDNRTCSALTADNSSLLINNIGNLFKSIGLTRINAPIVYIVSHGSVTSNNHYQSTLQCAACNGNHGKYNAKIMADFLNEKSNRQKLNNLGVKISACVLFVPVFHNTAKGEIEHVNSKVKTVIDITKDINIVNQHLLKDKVKTLPEINKKASYLWSKIVPEFGLCRHNCLIIGPRWLTMDNRLENSAFLHSYDYEIDNDGTLLASILKGPTFVAHQLNMQYFVSSASNSDYGSGDKTRHSIIASVGILESDSFALKYGLPKQAVEFCGKKLHVPTRLRIYIYAPKAIIDLALLKSQQIKQLRENNWIFIESVL